MMVSRTADDAASGIESAANASANSANDNFGMTNPKWWKSIYMTIGAASASGKRSRDGALAHTVRWIYHMWL